MKDTPTNSLPPAAGEAEHTPVIEIYTHVLGASVIERTGHHSKVIQDFRSLEEANAFVLGHRIAYDADQRKIKALTEALENAVAIMRGDAKQFREQSDGRMAMASDAAAERWEAALALAKEGQK